MSLSHVLLGVLADGPAHGYDLKRAHDARFPGSKELAYGQVYAALQRMERDGQVEVAETAQDAGPERRVYALTDAGREALTDWVAATEPAGPYSADELVRKTVTTLYLGGDAGAFVERQRAVHLERMRVLLAAQRATTDPAGRVALDHAVFHLDADLRWMEAAASRASGTTNEQTSGQQRGQRPGNDEGDR